jgi:hypothetical protein
MKINFSFFFVFTLATHTFADVENSLTWQQAIELLKKNNPDYQSAELAFKATTMKCWFVSRAIL